MKSRKSFGRLFFGMVLLSLSLSFVVSTSVFAESQSGTGGGGDSHSASGHERASQYRGATWVYYTYKNSDITGAITMPIERSTAFPSVNVYRCGKEEYGNGFWLIGLEQYNDQSMTSSLNQLGSWYANRTQGWGGSTPFLYPGVTGTDVKLPAGSTPRLSSWHSMSIINGSGSLDIKAVKYGTKPEVNDEYRIALDNDVDGDLEWDTLNNSDISYFCSGPTTKKATFVSRSKVSWPDTGYDAAGSVTTEDNGKPKMDSDNTPIPAKTIRIPSAQDSIDVEFTHYAILPANVEKPVKLINFLKNGNAETNFTISQYRYEANDRLRTGTAKVASLTRVDGTKRWRRETSTAATKKVTVKFNKGEKKKLVCQRNTLDPITVKVKQDGDAYSRTKGSGSDYSQICIQITRENAPDDCPPGTPGCPSEEPSPSGTPSSSPTYTTCPLPGSQHSQYYGNTVAETKVKNYNNSDWESSVLAKPGDEIQFRHTLCTGAQAVQVSKSQVGSDRSAIARLGTSQLDRTSAYSFSDNVFPANTFSLSAERNNKYLFDRTDLIEEQRIPKGTALNKSTYTNPRTAAQRELKNFYSRIKPDEIYTDYGFRLYSPKTAKAGGATSYSSNPFNCSPLGSDWVSGRQPNAYRIPGFDLGASDAAAFLGFCNSAVKNWPPTNDTVYSSDVGSSISQTLAYKNLKTNVGHSHRYSSISCPTDTSIFSTGNTSLSYSNALSNSQTWGYVDDGECQFSHQTHTTHTDCSNGSCSSWTEYFNHYNHVYPEPPSRLVPSSGSYYDINIEVGPTGHETATVKVPYNFNTRASAKITSGASGVVYAGEKASSEFNYAVLARENSKVSQSGKYLTITPDTTTVRFVQFIISPDVDADTAKSRAAGGVSPDARHDGPCAYYEQKLGATHCENIESDINGPLNKRGYLNDSNVYNATSYVKKIDDRIIPDVEVGSKYCVAMGISHADSHGLPDQNIPASEAANTLSMGDTNPRWRISNAACRTIAKKPNFQAWGGIYTQGKVITSLSNKERTGVEKLFGSWSDTLVIAGDEVKGLASGATLGYNNNGGGANANTKYCRLIPMTISNVRCRDSERNEISGAAGYIPGLNNQALLESIRSRYSLGDKPSAVRSGANIAARSGEIINSGAVEYAYVNGDANLGEKIIQTSGTRVIEVKGTLTIDHNICAGTGDCENEPASLVLKARNSTAYTGIAQIPQVIIIAKNINITPNVTQIDAWLFAESESFGISTSGEINTCYEAGVSAHASSEHCKNTIIFNGPVFAKTLKLNRTAGAFPGINAIGSAKYDEDLASTGRGFAFDPSGNISDPKYGSLTSAEIFNLRSDAYYWAYNQSNRLTQATTVYMRELAPRY